MCRAFFSLFLLINAGWATEAETQNKTKTTYAIISTLCKSNLYCLWIIRGRLPGLHSQSPVILCLLPSALSRVLTTQAPSVDGYGMGCWTLGREPRSGSYLSSSSISCRWGKGGGGRQGWKGNNDFSSLEVAVSLVLRAGQVCPGMFIVWDYILLLARPAKPPPPSPPPPPTCFFFQDTGDFIQVSYSQESPRTVQKGTSSQ